VRALTFENKVGVLESSSGKKKMPTKQQFEDCKDTKKNQNNTENTSRNCSLENKVGVLKSSSVKNKKQHRKHLEDCKGGRNTKTTWRMHQEPALLRTRLVS
jgi:hypothetical protein